MDAGSTASHAMLLPRPSIQLIADGFLSVHMLPERPSSSEPGYCARGGGRAQGDATPEGTAGDATGEADAGAI